MKATWVKLRPRVLRRIKPSAALTRKAKSAAQALQRRAERAAKKLGVDAKPLLVGSLAKETHLSPAPDIDVFLMFDPATSREDLEEKGLRIGTQILQKPTLKYAEHPYVHGRFGGFSFDVVPAYRIPDPTGKISAVDRSPFHTRFVKSKLKGPKRDEVRVLKQFLKGIGCYGAETATSGFSGYLAELLVIRFGSFWDTLGKLREVHPPVHLSLGDEAGAHGGDLVFADPVDPRRNAAAAVSRERLDTFLRAARAFTAVPSTEFFWPKPLKAETQTRLVELLSHRGIVGLELPKPKVRPDALLPHVRRFGDKVARHLEDEGFRIVRHMVSRGGPGFLLLWEHEPVVLPETYEHRGPSVEDAANSRRFLEKWQNHPDATTLPHPEDGHWMVTLRRRQRDPLGRLAPQLSRLLQGVELPASAARRAKLRLGIEFARRPGTRLALTKMLLPRDPWEP